MGVGNGKLAQSRIKVSSTFEGNVASYGKHLLSMTDTSGAWRPATDSNSEFIEVSILVRYQTKHELKAVYHL